MDEQQKLWNQFKKKSIAYTNKQFKANIKVPHSKSLLQGFVFFN